MSPAPNAGILVVGGFDALATALRRTGRFDDVVSLDSTKDLQQAIAQGLATRTLSSGVKVSRDTLTFLFASSMKVNTPTKLNSLVSGLASKNYRVGVLATDANTSDLVTAGASEIPGPFRIDSILGALYGMGVQNVPPVGGPEGNRTVSLDLPFEVQEQATPAPRPSRPASSPTPKPEPKPASPPPPPAFKKPPQSPQTPARPSAPTPAQAPRPAQPSAAPPRPAPSPFDTGSTRAGPADSKASPFDATPAAPQANPPTPPKSPFNLTPPPAPAAPKQAPPVFTEDRDDQSRRPAPPSQPARPAYGPPQGSIKPRRSQYGAEYGTQNRNGKVIVVVSRKGGAGKSTLSLNLAAMAGMRLRSSGGRVALVDGNLAQPDIGHIISAYEPNIYQLTKEQVINDTIISKYLVPKPELNLNVLIGSPRIEETNPDIVQPRLFVEVVKSLRRTHDYIFVDCPVAEGFHRMYDEFVIPSADFFVDVVTQYQPTVFNNYEFLTEIMQPKAAGGYNISADKIGVLLNQSQENVNFSVQEVRDCMSDWRWLGEIPNGTEWLAAANASQVVVTMGYPDINSAILRTLHNITADEAFRPDAVEETTSKKKNSLFKKLFK